jgi:hypothetical protein
VIVDGQEERQYNANALINLTFSRDSRHFAFEVHGAGIGKSFVVVDDREGKHYDELLAGEQRRGMAKGSLRFTAENSVTYLARKGRKFYRVTQPLP